MMTKRNTKEMGMKLSVIAAMVVMGTVSIVADENVETVQVQTEEMTEQQTADQKLADAQVAADMEAMEAAKSEETERDVLPIATLGSQDVQPQGSESATRVHYGDGSGTQGSVFTYVGGYAANHAQSGASDNSFFGYASGYYISTGDSNSAFGGWSLYNLSTGSDNSIFGNNAGYSTNTGSFNVMMGRNAGYRTTTGSENVYLGYQTGYTNTAGGGNVLIGSNTGYYNTTSGSTFVGYNSGYHNTSGANNTFLGYRTGYANTTGGYNTYIGREAGRLATTGTWNTFLGYVAGYNTTTGGRNTFLGEYTGYNNKTGSNNVFIGAQAGYSETGSNKLYIDVSPTTTPLIYGEFNNDLLRINGTLENTDTMTSSWTGSSSSWLHQGLVLESHNTNASANSEVGFSLVNSRDNLRWDFRLNDNGDSFSATKRSTGGNEFNVYNDTTNFRNVKVKMGGVTVFENGHLVTASSRELKTDIKPLDAQAAMDAFHKLQPVCYEYKAQKGEPVVGFIAEDVPALVAMPSRKTFDSAEVTALLTKVVQEQDKVLSQTRKELKEAQEKIARLEKMEKKVAMMESILTNLALDTSKSTKEKVSLNQK